MSIAVCVGMDQVKTSVLTLCCPLVVLVISLIIAFVIGLHVDTNLTKELEMLDLSTTL